MFKPRILADLPAELPSGVYVSIAVVRLTDKGIEVATSAPPSSPAQAHAIAALLDRFVKTKCSCPGCTAMRPYMAEAARYVDLGYGAGLAAEPTEGDAATFSHSLN